MTNRSYISRQIVEPLIKLNLYSFDGDFGLVLTSSSVKAYKDADSACESLLKGEVLVAVNAFACTVNAQDEEARSVGEAESDITVKGPKTAFIEDAETNAALLRRYIRSDSLKFISYYVGSETHTKVLLCFVEGRADKSVVETLKSRLSSADTVSAVGSDSLPPLLTGKKGFPFFPLLGSSEKVDKVASKLVAGRVAVICDGSPFVLTAPYVFAESLQSAEDYLRTAWYATFMRLLRFAALITALFLPAIYVCLKPSADMLLDLFVTLIIFEVLREVGVRMPRTVGDAVGIVGSLIIGDAAVQAGLTSDECIIVVALSAVCSFIVPVYMYATALLRLVFIGCGFLLGFPGLAMSFSLLIGILCGTQSFGSPYMSPLSPVKPKGLMDFLLAVPGRTVGRRERL